MTQAIIFLIIGLCLLVWSADRLVYGAAALANNFGIPSLVIGMTILAMGSSAPEMVVSANAALDGKTNTAIGNVLGSNIANIALILGFTALFKPLSISSGIVKRELPIMMAVTLFAGVLLWDSYLEVYEGISLLILFFAFLYSMYRIGKKEAPDSESEEDSEIPEGVSSPRALFWVVLGLVVLPYSADLMVESAVTIATFLGMSDLVIGLTIIAIGTSLPELAASMAGVIKGEHDMAIGNVIGSNIFNILAVMGIPALINPSELSVFVMQRDFTIMLVISLLLVVLTLSKTQVIGRSKGLFLVLLFLGYQGYLFHNIAG
ncbi:calcium/sodium antiporter [Vibrio sp. JC009]|uniref:calcium/sodium antiporter n=1 Tax=Vibrio sp. JC009 TaxID=2912314 RepID=UPI0023B13983|nr:calcium/sodium antiporter [Vibrio sp. JC009]WED21005.1 calcium/sodium antiporter [Vibrio sp. JC009]